MLIRPEQQDTKPLVKWKDLLSRQWKGPDPLLTSGRGCACIFHRMQILQFRSRIGWFTMLQSPRHLVPPLLWSQRRRGTPLPLPPPPPLHRTAACRELQAGPAWLLGTSTQRSQPIAPPASVCACLAAAEPEAGSVREQGRCPPAGEAR